MTFRNFRIVEIVFVFIVFGTFVDPSSGQGIEQLFSGLSGMIDTAKSIQSATSSMSSIFSNLMNSGSNVGKREGDRYRHSYYINPLTRSNISTRMRHIPRIWDMASDSYRVEFMLYTRRNMSTEHEEVLLVANASTSTTFDRNKETKMIIHDYNQTYSDPLLMDLRDVYLESKDYNVIMVDWIQARKYSYTVAARVSEYVGVQCARFLMELDANLSKIHAIGFGLGAHAAGVMGHDLNGRLHRITGLDPSLILFRMALDNQKLDSSDATFVDVIHSDSGDNFWHANHLGMGKPIGHVDIYANSGIFQPGCPTPNLPSYEDMYCSHIRALELFVESTINKESLIACSCDSWSSFKAMACDCTNKMIYVGNSCPLKAKGSFYMVTKDRSPYGMGRNGAFPIPQFNQLSV